MTRFEDMPDAANADTSSYVLTPRGSKCANLNRVRNGHLLLLCIQYLDADLPEINSHRGTAMDLKSNDSGA